MMDSARWEQIQSIFHRALDLPEQERPTFLAAECSADAELLAEVRAMLQADSRDTSLLDRGLPEVAYQMVGPADEAVPPQDFGPYRLQRVLGEGGMGVVWLAERRDAGNLVAIKFLPHAGLSPARRERFTQEIKTLGKLNHPFIARLYDAGSLADGTPWFVMEYVDGVRFIDYCRDHRLSVAERLHLFRSVCEAVQYAHGQEIIHRDLKPSNILVDENGAPRLLDFGIARELRGLDAASQRTRPGLRFLSPDYAPPEWVRDGNVGFYTDVYSLGVILYETVAGQLPFDRSQFSRDSERGFLAEPDPNPPSLAARRAGPAGVGGEQLSRAAWGDLDVLCLKAMHKDPQQRYASVEALIRDLDHYLKREPLEARPDSVSYRLEKFVSRNRRSVLASSLAFAVIVALVVVFTLRLAKARDAALAAAARTQRVEQFMENLFEGGDEEAGPAEDLRVVTLLGRGVRDAQALNTDPAVQAELYQTLGSVYEALGKLDRADALLQSGLEQRKRIFGPDSREVAETLLHLGVLRSDQDRLADAEGLIREALAMDKRHLALDDPAVARAMTALGRVLARRGNYDEAIALLNDAVRLQSAKGGVKTDLLASLSQLAVAQHYLGHYALSDSLNRRVLALDQQLHGDHHPSVADDFMNLGNVQNQLGNYQEAERYFRQAVEIHQSWYGRDNSTTADMMTYIAQALVNQGRYDAAESFVNESLPILEHNYPTGLHQRIALALSIKGAIAVHRGKLEDAENDYRRMAEIYRSLYGDAHQFTAVALSNLAGVYLKKGQYVRAETLLRDVVQRFNQALPAGHVNIGIAQIRLGRALAGEKRYPEAVVESLAGYSILTKQASPSAKWLQEARQDLAGIYDALKEPQNASKFRAEITAN
jgi:eukaryotic-like serine/threonine-protein kinase